MVSTQIAYTALIALVALERLYELALSKRNYARAIAAGGHEVAPGHFIAMSLMHTLFLVACVIEVWVMQRPFSTALAALALSAALFAQALRYWVISTLGERWNVRIVVVPGVPPIAAGPYRFMRHPNYLAVIIEMIALPMIHGAWLTAAVFSVLNAVVLVVRIKAEERALGPAYAARFSETRRFLPR